MSFSRILAFLALSAVLLLYLLTEITVLANSKAGTDSGTGYRLKFDLICTTTFDHVEGTLADGSPVIPGRIGQQRRYRFDLETMRYAINVTVSSIHAIEGQIVIKADPDEIQTFGDVIHMQSDWKLDLDTGLSIRINRFFSDPEGTRVTGHSEWHQQCERAPFTGLPLQD